MRNDTGHQLQKFDTNRITNSKMADKMASVQMHGCISSVYISFQVVKLIAFRCMPASILGFLVGIIVIEYDYGKGLANG